MLLSLTKQPLGKVAPNHLPVGKVVGKVVHKTSSFAKKIISIYSMPYKITAYTYKQAKRLGVIVKPSTDKTKKIDVFRKEGKTKTMKKIASVGAAGMNDFPTFIQKKGLAFAKTRRRLYKMRHERDRHTKGSRGYYADQLLW